MSDETPKTADPMAVDDYYSKRFDALAIAMGMHRRACILTVTEKATGKKVHLICVVRPAKDGSDNVDIAPIARMLDDGEHNNYEAPE